MTTTTNNLHLVQFRGDGGQRHVAIVEGESLRIVGGADSTIALAQQAIDKQRPLADVARAQAGDSLVDYATVARDGRLLTPVDHPDPYRMFVTGTGLTHVGSATLRSGMHGETLEEGMTDSVRLFRAGLEGGKPADGSIGVEPEWFFKCTGHDVLPSGAVIEAPRHGLSIAEEAELGGVYLIAPDGTPRRLGFVLANDVSDHAFERQNYMYIAASKLRQCPIGPELVVGDLPDRIEGSIRILRDGAPQWQGAFNSGPANMSHSIANLEYHHFKNSAARRPGDVHIHLFGCDATSGQDRFMMQDGDLMEIDVPTMGRPLRNTVHFATATPPRVTTL